ncbi:hypothetical protein LJC49_01125 [Ruminococcaceae bacterium OttesenSCG-928-I18]|nr:hypothetical protein [Ruminococcaceae bacterium OttesenSCG-928-I18]
MAEYMSWAECADTKEWLEQTGIRTTEASFRTPPAFPYQTFFEFWETQGPDMVPGALQLVEIHVDQYQETKNRDHEHLLEDLLAQEGVNYTKERTWVDTEKMWQTAYEFSLFKKG